MPFSSPISKYVFLSSDNIKHCNSSKLPSHHNFGQVRHVAGHGVGHISASFQLLIGSRLCSIKMSEKLCLQWNDFQDNIKSAFGNLREDNDFTDVTLACEDGQQVEAHKVILAEQVLF